MGTKTGELRETLLGAIDDLRSGRLKAVDAKAIAALAAQVNASLAAELAVRASGVDERVMGDLKLGHEVTPPRGAADEVRH